MPVTQADITALSSPIPVPTVLGDQRAQDASSFTSQQQMVNRALSGAGNDPIDVTLPIGDQQLITGVKSGFAGPTDKIGGGVAGLVGQRPEDPKKYETHIPEPVDPIEEETNEFIEASEGKGSVKMWNNKGEQITGDRVARATKRYDRKSDRQTRKDAGLKGKEKRRIRKAQRENRKSSWDAYKGEMDLRAQDEMLELEDY